VLNACPFQVLIEIGRTASHLLRVLDDPGMNGAPLTLFDPRLDRLAGQSRRRTAGARRLSPQSVV
jgi:hypothetical protein